MHKPKVLIVSASIGAGHTRAAEAVKAELARQGLVLPTVADFLDEHHAVNRLIKETYLKMLNTFPDAYDFLYRWSDEPRSGSNLISLTALFMKRRLQQLLREHRPSLIVFTHPFPGCAAAYLRRRGQLGVSLVSVLTDFAVHRLWVQPEIDHYCVAHRQMKQALAELGIRKEHISVTGIPISAEFAGAAAGRTVGGVSRPTLLIMGGGLGLGAVGQAVAGLAAVKRPLAITVVAGRNELLVQKVKEAAMRSPHPVAVYGYTDKVSELMADASLLITKAGALTCSEALATGLPMLLFKPIPGQEEENAAYLGRQGVALRVAETAELVTAVDSLLERPQTLAAMSRKALSAGRPAAAAAVAAVVHECLFSSRQAPTGSCL